MTPPAPDAQPAPADAAPSVRRLLALGSAWILGATFVRQALRLASSVILTRLLLPEAFGLVATASLLAVAVDMCSDFGVRQAIVHNPAGGTRRYLEVAWTMIALRGVLLGVVILALAGPFVTICGDERIYGIVLLSAANPVLQGLCSPGRLIWMKEMRQDRINQLDLLIDVARLPANVVGALIVSDAYGLVYAGLACEVLRVVLSYAMAPWRPTIRWEPPVARQLARYGRFVFLSTLLGFLAGRLDMLFVARYLGMDLAGVYYIAQALAGPAESVITQLLGGLFFPLLARSQHDPAQIRRHMWRMLRLVLFVGTPLAAVVVAAGPLVVGLLYDERYAAAGGVFRWLIVASYLYCFGTALNSPLMATGRPHWGTLATFVKLIAFCIGALLLGGQGVNGYAAAIALSTLAFTLVLAFVPWTPRQQPGAA